MSVCKTDALTAWRRECNPLKNWCGRRDSNPHSEEPASETGASTCFATSAIVLPPAPIEAAILFFKDAIAQSTTEKWCPQQGLSLRASAYKTAALHLSYAGFGARIEIIKRPSLARPKQLRYRKPPCTVPPKGTSTELAGRLMSLQGRPS